MRTKYTLFIVFLLLLLINMPVISQNSSYNVVIDEEELEINAGDTVEIDAALIDSNDVEVDTSLIWSVKPDGLGSFLDEGLFRADSSGEGWIYAEFGTSRDSVSLKVEEAEFDDDNQFPYLTIIPQDIEIMVGDTIQFNALYFEAENTPVDTAVSWSLQPDSLGSIDSTGLLVASKSGEVKVTASLDTLTAMTEVTIEKTEDEDEGAFPYLIIVPQEMELSVGDTANFDARYVTGENSWLDTNVTWSISPDSIANVDSTGQLAALMPGEGVLSAVLDSLNASVEIEIEDSTDGDDDGDEGEEFENHLVVMPSDTSVMLGASVQYKAYHTNEAGDVAGEVDSSLTWQLEGMPVGDLSSDGLLTTDSIGFALVKASLDEDTFGSAFVIVRDSTADTTGNNSITITKSSPNPQGYSTMRKLTEGEEWTIGGLPHPMNVLNGGKVYFPEGSLKEDIRIHMQIPQFFNDEPDSLEFGENGVVSGVNFQVYVDDTLQEPYYFETPIIAGLVYKRGLLRNLNIDPQTLGLYFMVQNGDSLEFDSTGIEYTTLDLTRNRIFSTVAHFSTLAVKGKEGSLVNVDDKPELSTPNGYKLSQNYPNPFNPSTRISYYLPEKGKVKLTVYNILGKEVKTLVNKVKQKGKYTVTWDGTNSKGNKVSAGVYLYQLRSKDFIRAKKMILVK